VRKSDDRYVVLNREYKPLGFKVTDFINHDELPVSTRYTGITPALAAALSWNGSPDLDQILLYNDATRPTIGAKEMGAYLERLAKLARVKVAV
jgi:hypothetical protein